MARTRLQQDTQVRKSPLYADTLPAGVTLETGVTTLEDDLNAVRSQLRRSIFADAVGNWYADIPTVNGKKRAISALNTGLDAAERTKALSRKASFIDFTVPVGQNWKILSVGAVQTPPAVAAVALTTDGAVVAQSGLSGAAFDAFESIVVAGSNAINVKNLLLVRETSEGFSLPSAGRLILGLLQYEASGVDGAAFNDVPSGNRVKISFVRPNAGLDALEPCPVADIAGRSINYAFIQRVQFDVLSEADWLESEVFARPLPSGVSQFDFLLDCDPDAVNNTNTITRVSGHTTNETWVNNVTSLTIKTADYTRSLGVLTIEVVKVYAADGTTVVAQKTVNYARVGGKVTTITTTRNI